jgi:hypothetical protein
MCSANPAAPAQLATVTMQMALPHPAAVFAERDGQQQAEKLVLCGECNKNYEREASMVKAEAGAADLRAWLLQPPAADHKVTRTNRSFSSSFSTSMLTNGN